MLRAATRWDMPAIASLWQEAFGEPAQAVSSFFDAFPGCLSYVAVEDGTVVSMVHALPQVLSPDIPAAYIYAVATLQSHRGRGLCARLMAFAETDLQQRGFSCCVLTPGEPSLFAFYDRLGYAAAFTRCRSVFSGGVPISLPAYLTRREALLTVPHMVCDEATLEYARQIYGLSFYETEDGIAAASSDYTAEVLPQDLGGSPFAMIKWLTAPQPLHNAYLGFALE